MTDTLTGSCLCGGVKYSVAGLPNTNILCHCITCQKLSGSAFQANAFFVKSVRLLLPPPPTPSPNEHGSQQFTLLSGSDLLSHYESVPDGGAPVIRSFCSVCGSNLYASPTSPELKDSMAVMTGGLDEVSKAKLVPPQAEFFCKSKRAWVQVQGETAKFQSMT